MLRPRHSLLAAVFLFAALAAHAAPPRALHSIVRETDAVIRENSFGESLAWYDSLDNALGLAKEEYRPVLIFFHSPTDGWSARMRAQVFADEAVKAQLEHFVRVEVAIEDHTDTAGSYMVRGIPAVRVLSAEGRILNGRDGFVGAPEMSRMLRSALNAEFLKKTDPEFQALIEALEKKELPAADWPKAMLNLGEPQKRETLRQLILKLNPFPREEFVSMLADPRLAVRLGSLEVLEEVAGANFGFDPWAGSPDSPENKTSIDRWLAWVDQSGEEGITSLYSVLTEEQISSYIRDLVGDNRERSVRAGAMLRTGGSNAARSLKAFLDHNPELHPESRNRVREIYYAITVPAVGGSDPETIAHRLIFGNLDSRLETIAALKDSGRAALPVLTDFLNDADPLVRETSMDAVLNAGGSHAIPVVEEHLARETDGDVVMAALRIIGVNEISTGAEIAANYADHDDEDLSVMALECLAALRAGGHRDAIESQLADDRWRVRVAALEAIGKISEGEHSEKVRDLLDDEDEFVRVAAVQTVAKLNDSGAADQLLELYRKHEEIRGPVISSLLSLNRPLPKTLKADLAESDPDAILSVVDAVSQSSNRQLDAIEDLAHHENLDVACASLRVIAGYGMGRTRYQTLMADVLEKGQPQKAAAVLDSMEFETYQYNRYRSRFATESPSLGVPPDVQFIYDAFLQREAPKGQQRSDPLTHLFDTMEPYLDSSRDDAVRHAAALLLAKAGHPGAVEILERELGRRSIAQRKEVADSLGGATAGVLPVLVTLLRDRSEEVRKEAANTLLNYEDDAEFVKTYFNEVSRPGTPLKPWDVDLYYLRDAVDEGSTKRVGNAFARSVLESPAHPALTAFAALTLRYSWSPGDEELLLPLTESPEPELRRAAWFAIGLNQESLFKSHVGALANDPSEKVRAVVPFVIGGEDRYFIHYFDDTHSQRFYDYTSNFDFNHIPRPLDEETRQALLRLTEDSSPAIRIESAFVLMARGEKLDPASLEATLSSFPDRDSIQTRVSDYLETNYRKLDKEYRFLLNHIDSRRISSEDLNNIHAHFGTAQVDEKLSSLDFVNRTDEAGPDSPPEQKLNAPVPGNREPQDEAVELIFFYNPGCKECDRVEEQIEEMKASFPRLTVSRRNIRDSESAQLNEALCSRFDVPERIRMVTPAVFTGEGYLIKDEILPVDLGNLIVRSSAAGNSATGWSALGTEEIATAGAAIEQRFSSVGFLVILSAGVLDGINPCAFATIILFLSYLQIARHGPREILMVGIAFISAVFLTYFVLGLGLVEVVSRIQFLQGAALVLNWGLAIFALVIMVLSLRDGVLCVQGRLAETTLQLPGFLKDRIRMVARTGARHHRFVIAAFASGAVISLLELACTGQVYLPTITYMVQAGKTSAYFLLLIYNLAFVLPLVVIFILAFYGMRSDALIAFQAKHSAAIKFATAALFLALFLLLMFQIYR